MHIGAEGASARHTPDRVEHFAGENRGNSVAFARAAVEGGASLVIGSGPHVLRAIEWSGHALVAHSLGNLVTYGPFNHSGYNDHGAILCATLAADGSVRDAVLRSTVQRAPGYVQADPANLGARDVAELSRKDFPATGAEISPSGEIKPRPNRSGRAGRRSGGDGDARVGRGLDHCRVDGDDAAHALPLQAARGTVLHHRRLHDVMRLLDAWIIIPSPT